jgi:cathepsin A (carboxypeptidase C)
MCIIFASALLAAATIAAPDAERVPSMPDMGDFDKFSLYSGYIPLNDGKKNMHYMFVEAAENPSEAPVLIWTNGGPGCSSMLGFMQENGPYHIASGATGPDFSESATSWNREANVLYLDQPAGVGFSTCAGNLSCTFNDHTSGQDNLDVILAWFEKYPEFKNNDLFLSGESYGGIYVPYMAYFIDQHNTDNAADDSVFKPNLKGFAVGNGVTNWDYDTTAAFVEMGYWHSLYDTALYDQF